MTDLTSQTPATSALLTFDHLAFLPHPGGDGVRATSYFGNGYGVSVINSPYSYGGRDGLYELAVLRGTPDGFELAFDTPVTDDVLGHLRPDMVTKYMADVQALPLSKPVGASPFQEPAVEVVRTGGAA